MIDKKEEASMPHAEARNVEPVTPAEGCWALETFGRIQEGPFGGNLQFAFLLAELRAERSAA
jgi:hypothetical protein